MFVLVLDTSTAALCVGLVEVSAAGESIVQQQVLDHAKHAELLIPTVQQILSETGHAFLDLDAIIVGEGPGPFTGLRVGMATAAALGHALGIPVHGLASHIGYGSHLPHPCAVISDARRREVYWTVFGTQQYGPDVVRPAALELPELATIQTIAVPEQLHSLLPEDIQDIAHGPLEFRADAWVQAVDLESTPEPLVPLYLRRPDAKEPTPLEFPFALPKEPHAPTE